KDEFSVPHLTQNGRVDRAFGSWVDRVRSSPSSSKSSVNHPNTLLPKEKSPVVLPSDIFPIIARHCHPLDARKLQLLNKEISSVITTKDLVWSEARWRWSQAYWKCWDWAAYKGHIDVVRWCLESDRMNVHVYGGDALCRAADGGHLDIVKLLLDEGVDLHAHCDEALSAAAENGHLEVVSLLLERGVDLHARGDEAFRVAASWGHVEVVRLFLGNGADVHARGNEALRTAARMAHMDMVGLLLEKGADVHACEDVLAKISWNKELVSLFLDYGACMPQTH
ncbi:hypothetical protein HK104_011321, partial [Borealophlyctis nickersoniae]